MRDFNQLDFYIQKKRIKLIEPYVPHNSYLLDIGCGCFPQNLINLENKFKGAIGIDKDIPAQSFSQKVGFQKAYIETQLPFSDNQFDCLLMLAVLEHLNHPQAILQECYRILKPGGRLIITIPSNFSKPLLLSLAFLGLLSQEEIFDHKFYFSQKQMENMLEKAHFKKVVSKAYNLFMNLLFVYEKGYS